LSTPEARPKIALFSVMLLPSDPCKLNATFFIAAEPSLGIEPKTSISPLEDEGCTIPPLVDACLSSSIVYKANKNIIRQKGTDGHTTSLHYFFFHVTPLLRSKHSKQSYN
jgi:hypothetical protein